jgi:PII-like signaling protein
MTPPKRDWKAHSIEGVFLRFIVHENRCFKGRAIHDWLLGEARRLEIPGGCAFRGIAGYGRHGVMIEEHFFELANDLPLEVRFVCSEEQAGKLLDVVDAAELSLFYVMSPTRYGVAGVERSEWSKLLPPMF